MSLIFNGNADLDSVVYNGNEVEVVMCDGVEVWRRIKYVDVPTLSGTSYSTTGGTVGPTVNGFDSSIMTQEGTVSANWPGTYTVTWKLNDTKRYCWADGSTDAKSVSWTVTGGTITWYVKCSGTGYDCSTYWGDAQKGSSGRYARYDCASITSIYGPWSSQSFNDEIGYDTSRGYWYPTDFTASNCSARRRNRASGGSCESITYLTFNNQGDYGPLNGKTYYITP